MRGEKYNKQAGQLIGKKIGPLLIIGYGFDSKGMYFDFRFRGLPQKRIIDFEALTDGVKSNV